MKVTFVDLPRIQEGGAYPEPILLVEIDLPMVPQPGVELWFEGAVYKVQSVRWSLAKGFYDETGNGDGYESSASAEVFVERR